MKKICPVAASHTFGLPEQAPVRRVHEVEPVDRARLGQHAVHHDVVRAEGQHADHQDGGEDEEDRHADLGQPLDAGGESLADHPEIDGDGDEEEDERRPEAVHGAVLQVHVGPEVGLHRRLVEPLRGAAERGPGPGQGPRLDVAVVDQHHHRHEEPQHAEILGDRVLPDALEHARDAIRAPGARRGGPRPTRSTSAGCRRGGRR